MEWLDKPSHIIVYFEDPSYARVPDEESREIIRRWRFKLERVLGLYNAKLIHTCTDECQKPIIFDIDPNDDDDDENNNGQRYEFVAGPIDTRHNLFGCPRSGIVHWCPPQELLRRRACTFRALNTIGEVVCRFSGRRIEEAEWEYDRYVDTTIHPVAHEGQAESSSDRDARIASGLDKNNESVVQVTREEKEEKERAVVEQKALQSVNRSLESRYKRNQNKANASDNFDTTSIPRLVFGNNSGTATSSSHVVPVIERSPRKVSAVPTPRGSVSMDNTEASLITQALTNVHHSGAEGAGNGKHKKRYEAGHSLSVTLDTHRSMKRIIIDLIASPGSHTAVRHETPALASPTHAYVELCLKRAAKIYALVSRERELDKKRSHDRNHRGGACVGLNVRELTVTTLYTYARGYNIENENLIPRDEYLAKLLPIPRNLQWYGIDPTMRQHLLETNERLPKSSKIYDESMTNKAFVQIQQMINNFPRGKVILRSILEDV